MALVLTAGQMVDARKVPVVATTGMIGDVVREVGGDRVETVVLIGEGIDPHLYNPTRRDIVALDRASIVFYNGLFLEGKMGEVLRRFERRGKPAVAVAERIVADGAYSVIEEEDENDPHLWMDVGAWIEAVKIVEAALANFDPEGQAVYSANAKQYRQKLHQLNLWVKAGVESIPGHQKVLVTAHDAFGYFGRAYGIEVRGIQGISTESEAGLRDIEELVTFLVDARVPAVFVETSVPEKNVRALVEGARARGHEVSIPGTLYSDSMGAAGTWEGTYIGMIEHNVRVIVRGLGGNPDLPELREMLQ
ncbi:MAG: metal ABC transporter solute-binding protein, Zn/Mn family [Puniceicoccaceae bacterium]